MTKSLQPGRAARLLAYLTALLMALLLAAGSLVLLTGRVLSDRDLHAGVATDSRVQALQRERIDGKIDSLAAVYGFSAPAVRAAVSDEALRSFNLEVVDWWMGLWRDDAQAYAPTWSTTELVKLIRSDEGFLATVPSDMRTTVARDEIAYGIGSTLERVVLPVRTSLTEIGLPMVYDRVDVARLAGLMPMAGWLCLGGAALLLALTAALLHRRASMAVTLGGAAIIAAALTLLTLGAGVALLDLPGLAGEVSVVLGLQLSLLLSRVGLRLGVICALMILAGAALTWLGSQRRRNA